MKELEKVYDPTSIEDRIYKNWEEKGYFHAKVNPSKKPYTIVMPPPNITGQLHMGHAMDNAIQDILIRFKRMQGYETLWQPGTDHASIATEAKIVAKLREEGTTKEELGREKFLERAWEWKKQYGGKIVSQLRKIGSSCDWERERFTMDEGCSRAVRTVFKKFYDEKLIYRGNRMVNWCPTCNTSISDAEVEYEEKDGFFWHLLYPVQETGEMLELATTRPETMLGDTAVAIHPDDPRYAHLHGCHVLLPLCDRVIPIVTDEHADMEKGTGVVKITPAHDPNDFEVGNRHNLERIRVFTYDGRMTGPSDVRNAEEAMAKSDDVSTEPRVLDCGKYAGLPVLTARKMIVDNLTAGGFLKETESIKHDVGTCYRCHSAIEPMISKQWFVRMKPLAEPAIKAVEEGKIRFVPERFEKTYMNWMKGTRDWCISRQLYWGHQIPAWYCGDCGETTVAMEDICACGKCGSKNITRDPDTLDTWFSSALWPFSTLGWPDQTPELQYFYPTDTLVTGYDIIGFWVSRMIFSGLAHMDEEPFKTVYIHGLVRDSKGRKMSKSLNNGIDPLEIIRDYGADALRMMLLTGNAPGNDMRFYYERVEAARNFCNKIWNATRFIMMNLEKAEIPETMPENLRDEDRWILSKCNDVIREVTENMEKFELGIALSKVYDFTWDEFCDWYIEMVKPRLYSETDDSKGAALFTLRTVLLNTLKLLHPYIPFVTEEIFTNLQDQEETIMLSDWPVYREEWNFRDEEKAVEIIKETVRGIRNLRTEMNVPPSKKAQVYIVSMDRNVREIFEKAEAFTKTLSYASEILIREGKDGIPANAVSAPNAHCISYMPLSDLVDFEKERERLNREKEKIENEIRRSESMLKNEKFLEKAPADKVQAEREKKEKYEVTLKNIMNQLEALK